MRVTATHGSYLHGAKFEFRHQYDYYVLRLSVIFLSTPIRTICGGVQLGNNAIHTHHMQFILR